MSDKKSFWATVPGILTGTAGIITALGGFLLVLSRLGVIGPGPEPKLEPEPEPWSESDRRPEPEPEPWSEPDRRQEPEPGPRPEPDRRQEPEPEPRPSVGLRPVVTGLKRGSNTFSLSLANRTANQTFEVLLVSSSWAIMDNLNHTYELDRSPSFRSDTMFDTTMRITVPPNTNPSVKIILKTPIDRLASRITFALNNVWAQTSGSAFKKPQPSINWSQEIP